MRENLEASSFDETINCENYHQFYWAWHEVLSDIYFRVIISSAGASLIAPVILNTPKKTENPICKALYHTNVHTAYKKKTKSRTIKADRIPPSFPTCQDMQDPPEQVCSLWCQSECKCVSDRQGALVHLLTSAWHRQQTHPVVQLIKKKKKEKKC